MKKKGRKIFPLILFISVPIIWLVFFNNSKENISERFIVKDVSDVSSVVIKKNNQSITIKKNEDSDIWYINDTYEAEKKAVKKLIQAMTEVKINKPVSKEKIDSIKNIIRNSGKSILVYDDKNKKIKEWHIAEFDQSAEGTYILSDFEELPYIISIPGLEKDLNQRYNLHPFYWINPEIFSYKPHEIKEIEIQYSDNSKTSFKIEIDKQIAKIFSFSKNEYENNIDQSKVGSYLSYFMNVKFSSFNVLNKEESDSIKNEKASFTIIVKDHYNRTKTVELHRIKSKINTDKYDFNNLYAIINQEDIVIVKYFDIDLILKDISYFN